MHDNLTLQEYTVTTADLFNIIVYIKDEIQHLFLCQSRAGHLKRKRKLYS